MKVMLERDPFERIDSEESFGFPPWPASWVHLRNAGDADGPGAGDPPFVLAYRCRFDVKRAETVRIHVSADERYELFLDGERVGRGPERGTPLEWFFESYDLELAAGAHVLVARVWSLGKGKLLAPSAQMRVHHGFLLAAQGPWNDVIGTGVGAWEAKRLGGYTFIGPGTFAAMGSTPFAGAAERVDAATFAFGFERGDGAGWAGVEALSPGRGRGFPFGQAAVDHHLRPAMLPAQLDERRQVGTVRLVARLPVDADPADLPVRMSENDAAAAQAWQAMLSQGRPVTVAAGTRLRVIVDLDNYYCAYPQATVSGGRGGRVQAHWAEALYRDVHRSAKGNRDEIDGKHFIGFGDDWLPDGGAGRTFRPLWWRAGRYVQIVVEAADEPVAIDRLEFFETRYPFEPETQVDCDEPRLLSATPILVRGLQMCMHETYVDCPYYEQLMYLGDTRLEVLATYVLTHDDRLPRKAVEAFDWSQMPDGLTQSRFPSDPAQIIPPFSLWWVCMVNDFAMWRGDRAFVADRMPGVRGVLESFRGLMNKTGLVETPPGWNFIDWDPGWSKTHHGAAPDAAVGVSGPLNWQVVLALQAKAELEAWLGESLLAQRDRTTAGAMAKALVERFWSADRGMLADDLGRRHFSEHSQCLALISGVLSDAQAESATTQLFAAQDLTRTTIYFSHYLFEACRITGRIDKLFERLADWYKMAENGLKTTIEQPEPARSDCHAWGAHPLFHLSATVLGIRPAAPGFREVTIRPQLGPLGRASGTVPHPDGEVAAELRREGDRIVGTVRVPESVGGSVIVNGKTLPIERGGCEIQ